MVDALGRQMSGPVLRPIMPERAKEIINDTKSRKIRILASSGRTQETRQQALICLLSGGLAALAKPPKLPDLPDESPKQRLVAFAGAEEVDRRSVRRR
jgi:hypothetical protein